MAVVFAESMQPTVITPGDQMPHNSLGKRKKLIHTRGAVANVKLVPADAGSHPFTGVFEGADYGLVRISAA